MNKTIIEYLKKDWKIIALLLISLIAMTYSFAAIQAHTNNINQHWKEEIIEKCPCLTDTPNIYEGNFSMQIRDVINTRGTK